MKPKIKQLVRELEIEKSGHIKALIDNEMVDNNYFIDAKNDKLKYAIKIYNSIIDRLNLIIKEV